MELSEVLGYSTPSSPGARDRTPVLDAAVDLAATRPADRAARHVGSLRRQNPEASPEQIIAILTKRYTYLVQGCGGLVGASAAVPGIGTGVGLVLTAADITTFVAASSSYALCVAEVHGVALDDVGRRRELLLASVLGESGALTLTEASGRSAVAWGAALAPSLPRSTTRQVNRVLARRVVRRYVARRASVALGRAVPFGIGAAVGVLGGRALARTVVHQTLTAHGPAPATFSDGSPSAQPGTSTALP